MTRSVELRSGSYHDSVTLMQVSRELGERAGVTAAFVAMATELNLDLLLGMGFDPPTGAGPQDLIVAVEAADREVLEATLAGLDQALSPRSGSGAAAAPSGGVSEVPPGTISAAARRGHADLALVSTPGRLAAIDAADALGAGLDVMVFSDNVSLADEVALKELAAASGLLVMGPDCGTAVVGGVGLGFANVVRAGPVGIVAASGTGAQHLMALLDGAGIGVAHCLGVGGRDLSAEVAGRSTRVAIDRLAADPDVTTIVLVSKPPDSDVGADLVDRAEATGKQVVVGYLGAGRPDLTATAASVAAAVGQPWPEPRSWGTLRPAARHGVGLRGLYSGGTLCDEGMVIAAERLGRVASNIPLAGHPPLTDDLRSPEPHAFIDFGDDRLTVGRPHPMIDNTLRFERLRTELADPTVAVVLLDIVLGHGAHPDPAGELAPVLAGTTTPVAIALIGTRDDPQGVERTAEILADAGALVHTSNAAAVRAALTRLTEGVP